MTAPLATADQIATFLFAGNARLTIVSKKTGARFTYQVKMSDNGHLWFVKVLTGSDNESDYEYLGTLNAQGFKHGKKSRISPDAPSSQAFGWFSNAVKFNDADKLAKLDVYHEGRCGRCNRTLTVPESIESGIGPDCAEIMGMPYGRKIKCDEVRGA